jgi:hypothetical protein
MIVNAIFKIFREGILQVKEVLAFSHIQTANSNKRQSVLLS